MSSILWPMLAHIGWTFLLYAWLTVAPQRSRAAAARSSTALLRAARSRANRSHHRNLANQFELPVIFYAVVVLLVAIDRVTAVESSPPGCLSPAASSTRWCRP